MHTTDDFPRLFPPADITPEALAELARATRLRWNGSGRTATFPGWAFADFMLLADVLDRVAVELGSQDHQNRPLDTTL